MARWTTTTSPSRPAARRCRRMPIAAGLEAALCVDVTRIEYLLAERAHRAEPCRVVDSERRPVGGMMVAGVVFVGTVAVVSG